MSIRKGPFIKIEELKERICPYCKKRILWKSNHITRKHLGEILHEKT